MTHSGAVEALGQRETVGEAVVSTVADVTDTEPLSLEPLYEAVDPETVSELFDRCQGGADRSPDRLEFTYSGCDVVVAPDGAVRVSNPDQESDPVEQWR